MRSSGSTFELVAAKAGQRQRVDFEYRRNSTTNLFVFLDAHRSWRKVKVTERRTAADFATCMQEPRREMSMDINWDGITLARTVSNEETVIRHSLADAAKYADWVRVFDLLSEQEERFVNFTRLDGSSWYAPLHQAAWHGAPVEIVRRLIQKGAWRALRNAKGERAVDVAERRGHRHLLEGLAPEFKHHVPMDVLLRVQAHFHAVIRERAGWLIEEYALRLPELEPLLELKQPAMWFRVLGMAGGFSYRLESAGAHAKLVSDSWCRVVGGSGQRHEITSAGSQLVEEGFV